MIKILGIIAYFANLLLPNRLAYRLANKLSTKDVLPDGDSTKTLIIPVAHGATETRLTKGAIAVAHRTRALLDLFPNSTITFGGFSGGNFELERVLKQGIFSHDGVRYYGDVTSTIEEPLGAIRLTPGIKFERVIVVTDQAHSFRCRLIVKTFFPDKPIYVSVVPLRATIDPESPMETYRNPWKAMIFQVLPTPIYWLWASKGPKYLGGKAQYHQPVAAR